MPLRGSPGSGYCGVSAEISIVSVTCARTSMVPGSIGVVGAARRPCAPSATAVAGRWPVGMPLCQPMGNGLWEIRTDLPTKRTARVLISLYRGHLVALHGFIKKTRATPDEDLAIARKRRKELAGRS